MDSRPGFSVTRPNGGFSLVELLVIVAVVGILAGIGMPMLGSAIDQARLASSVRDVERELQTARLKAVATKRVMRVRFDCPATGQFRMVELIGTPAAPATQDLSSDRCSPAVYPYAPAGNNPMVRPANDGPVRMLAHAASFTSASTVEFRPDGTAHANLAGGNPWPVIPAASPLNIVVARKGSTRTITVNGVGKIRIE